MDCSSRNRSSIVKQTSETWGLRRLWPTLLKEHSNRTRQRLIVLFAHITRHSVSFLSATKICKYHLQLSARNPRLSLVGCLTAVEGRNGVKRKFLPPGAVTSPPSSWIFVNSRDRCTRNCTLLGSFTLHNHVPRKKKNETKKTKKFQPRRYYTRTHNSGAGRRE